MSSMPEKEKAPIIETTSLSKDYQGLMALNSVDLSIPAGAVGLLGPNGAGKSTLIKCLLGLVVPSSGTSKVLGLSTEKLQTHIQAREKVGYVPENDCLIPNMDAVSFVKYMGEISGLPPMDAMQRAHEALHYVGIGDERYRKISTYSTGMKQKIKLAQAIVHDPELIILDEPTNGMDPKGRQEMLDLIKDIHLNHGKNILLSSHLLPDVEYICEHVVILNNGSVLVQGMIRDLTTTSDEYEIRIKGDEEQFKKVLTEMKLSFQKKGSFFMVRSKEDLLVRLYPAIKDKDIQIRHATRYRQTLEDIFMGKVTAGGGK